MLIVNKPHNNYTLHPPEKWDEEKYGKCETINVTREDGIFYSYWKPSWKEWIMVLFGRNIRLCMCSDFFPPVAIDTEE